MSQPSSELEFDTPDFDVADDSAAAETPPAPAPPSAPRYRKQGFSVYTVMLILSFICLLAALIVLFIEAGRYN